MTEAPPRCVAHPDEIAIWFCQQCKDPICDQCRVKVYGKSACRNCAGELHARTGAIIEDSSAMGSSATGDSSVESQAAATPYRFMLGILIAGGVGLIGALFWEKLVFYTHYSNSYIYIGIGIGIAYCIVHFGKREGPVSGAIAGMLYCGSMLYGHHLYVQDEVGKIVHGMGFKPKPLSLDVTWRLMHHGFSTIHWVLVAVGLLFAVGAGSMRLPKSSST